MVEHHAEALMTKAVHVVVGDHLERHGVPQMEFRQRAAADHPGGAAARARR